MRLTKQSVVPRDGILLGGSRARVPLHINNGARIFRDYNVKISTIATLRINHEPLTRDVDDMHSSRNSKGVGGVFSLPSTLTPRNCFM